MWMCVLGRQPELSLAELEARFGADNTRPVRSDIAVVTAGTVDIQHLGGTISVGRVLNELSVDSLATLPRHLLEYLPPAGSKQDIGLSVYGKLSAREVGRLALELKKLAKASGHKIRIIPNKEPFLSSAQILHNQLTKAGNAEFVVAVAEDKIYVAQTAGVQDIDAYRQRDVERPARDARVGMLPPKLAQIMLNLAKVQPGQTVLDPFCGTGVVLQEALLMGTNAYGSDIAQRMIQMSQTNLTELSRHHLDIKLSQQLRLEVADARNHQWQPPIDTVVSELYLGPPFVKQPSPAELDKAIREVDSLLREVLDNLHKQLPAGSLLVLAVPRWQNAVQQTSLPMLDRLEKIGYTSTRFVHAPGDLVYAREDQIVTRQLLVLSKT